MWKTYFSLVLSYVLQLLILWSTNWCYDWINLAWRLCIQEHSCAVICTKCHEVHANCSSLSSQKPKGHEWKEIQCLFCQGYLPAYFHNSQVILDISLPIGYHDRQSSSAPVDALFPVAQYCPAFHYWEYWESVWDAREWWEGSSAFQTGMDVESILSARRVHGKWPSIRWQGKVSKCIVCRVIIAGLACWASVWCNWEEMDGLPVVLIVTGRANWSIQIHMSAYQWPLYDAFQRTPNPVKNYSYT